jgi:hypothetical protein
VGWADVCYCVFLVWVSLRAVFGSFYFISDDMVGFALF